MSCSNQITSLLLRAINTNFNFSAMKSSETVLRVKSVIYRIQTNLFSLSIAQKVKILTLLCGETIQHV